MVIGKRIGAKEKAYFKGELRNLTVHTAWFPMIEVDGRMVYLKGQSPTGKMEADSLGEALRLAGEFRDNQVKATQIPERSSIEE